MLVLLLRLRRLALLLAESALLSEASRDVDLANLQLEQTLVCLVRFYAQLIIEALISLLVASDRVNDFDEFLELWVKSQLHVAQVEVLMHGL